VTSLLLVAVVCAAPTVGRAADPVPPAAANEPPLAGWHDGLFCLRDASDNFRLYVQGRVHVDALTAFGPGVGSLGPDSDITSRLTLRRVRPELSGEFFKRWQWQLSVDLAPSAIDNPAGQIDQPSCTVDAKTGAQNCTDRENAVEAASARPAPTDAFVNFVGARWFNVQVGQYLIPFTFENRMSDNTISIGDWVLGDRSLIGFPSNGKPNHLALHTVGEGPSHGLEVLVKGEDLGLTYDGASRSGADDPKTPDGKIRVRSATLGANYWATKHVRVSINYRVYDFPGSEPASASSPGGPTQTSAQRAIAPAQNLAAGTDDRARDGGHILHEVAMRVGIQF
jgi:hypothetical protein